MTPGQALRWPVRTIPFYFGQRARRLSLRPRLHGALSDFNPGFKAAPVKAGLSCPPPAPVHNPCTNTYGC